ncbi:MAG: glutathione ABC transporter permease GsiC [Zetaproteobacteria bacterium CG12_big_fil_rev_8_21_14_0_65_55_1124]|nr:MAG: glutathione ABC transporter permease GsiC [Zetaproteobacteria bacterium CG1_02_55_237]PIS19464.1 MAG: glutathione ABC transporter permease GsiC [Zetaproteobacteria bacterium CG08_land_8_20_14_0_20_55_17]PIW42297.1 MAG: glutathione ABC transporter permease GsiC [Zetaproteobacteria bacterium CG12_big_fil_rev_8_21_14_0_65_55_1124]PIY52532.1 MAG: glutathione ABC transporter permease GsiC [Zetaproteobacteria bacterium CG_4_10_14_0_8_um_filter_55_43]PIZ36906.1 MAG: glutathione ABC transporter
MLMRLILYRLLQAIPTLLGVATLVFLMLHLVPGDPVDALLGEMALPADREALRHALHLDAPLWTQYLHFMAGLANGDWGQSLIDQRPVLGLIAERLPATARLAGASLLLAVVLALPLGFWAARHAGKRQDMTAMGFSLLGVSIPNFWLGPMLMLLFSVFLGWLPVSGMDQPGSIILPAITLGTALAAVLSRMARSSWLEAMSSDAIRTARAMGVHDTMLWWRHAGRMAAIPVLTMFALQLGAVLGGAVITETVFDWPGLGLLTIEAIQQRNYPLVQGCVLLIASFYVLANLLADVLAMWLDPRQRSA